MEILGNLGHPDDELTTRNLDMQAISRSCYAKVRKLYQMLYIEILGNLRHPDDELTARNPGMQAISSDGSKENLSDFM